MLHGASAIFHEDWSLEYYDWRSAVLRDRSWKSAPDTTSLIREIDELVEWASNDDALWILESLDYNVIYADGSCEDCPDATTWLRAFRDLVAHA